MRPLLGAVVPSSLPEDLPLPAHGSDIAQLLALRAAACVGADYSNLALIDAVSPTQLRLFHRPFLDPAMTARYLDIPLAAPYPIAAAIRDQRIIVLNGQADYLAQFPEIWEDTQAAGIQATCSLPLCRSDGSPIGALGFAWSTPPPFDLKLDQALRAVGDLVAEIIERAEVYDAEHQLIATLHARLLSALPEVDGIATAARYQAAGRSDAIGGDWFEGLVLDDGTIAVVLGDVTGHGLTAAADMALIRGLITALLHDGVHVKDVFALVSRVLTRRPDDLLATAVVVLIDTAASTLTYATAGHPPPLLIHPDAPSSDSIKPTPDARDPDLRTPGGNRALPAWRHADHVHGRSRRTTQPSVHRRRRPGGGLLDSPVDRSLGGPIHRRPVRSPRG